MTHQPLVSEGVLIMLEEKILTKHPSGKTGRNISVQKYETLKKAILASLGSKSLTHTELFERLNNKLSGKFEGNISWYGETVKLDLEAVSYTHLRAHETPEHLVCRLLLEK